MITHLISRLDSRSRLSVSTRDSVSGSIPGLGLGSRLSAFFHSRTSLLNKSEDFDILENINLIFKNIFGIKLFLLMILNTIFVRSRNFKKSHLILYIKIQHWILIYFLQYLCGHII